MPINSIIIIISPVFFIFTSNIWCHWIFGLIWSGYSSLLPLVTDKGLFAYTFIRSTGYCVLRKVWKSRTERNQTRTPCDLFLGIHPLHKTQWLALPCVDACVIASICVYSSFSSGSHRNCTVFVMVGYRGPKQLTVSVTTTVTHGKPRLSTSTFEKSKLPLHVGCVSEDLKCRGAWDTTCRHKDKDITPSIAWRIEA